MHGFQTSTPRESILIKVNNAFWNSNAGQTFAVIEGVIANKCSTFLDYQIARRLIAFETKEHRAYVKWTIGSRIVLCSIPRRIFKRISPYMGETSWESEFCQTGTTVKSFGANRVNRGRNVNRNKLTTTHEE